MTEPPVRIQRKRTKGWRMPPNTIYVGRPSRWGNPWIIRKAREAGFVGTENELAAMCVSFFRNGLSAGLPAVDRVAGGIHLLRGKNLACWCPLLDENGEPFPCHADVLLELANK